MNQTRNFNSNRADQANAQTSTTTPSFQPAVSSNNPGAVNQTLRILDENHKLVRRHSFDDNGGGYQGL